MLVGTTATPKILIEFCLHSGSIGFKNERISEEEKEENASDKSVMDL